MSADRLGGFGNNRVVSDDDWRFDPPLADASVASLSPVVSPACE